MKCYLAGHQKRRRSYVGVVLWCLLPVIGFGAGYVVFRPALPVCYITHWRNGVPFSEPATAAEVAAKRVELQERTAQQLEWEKAFAAGRGNEGWLMIREEAMRRLAAEKKEIGMK